MLLVAITALFGATYAADVAYSKEALATQVTDLPGKPEGADFKMFRYPCCCVVF